MTTSRQATGSAAEDRACAFLQEKGVFVLARNINYRVGEIDIVASKNDTLIFVEVRSVSSDRFGSAAATIGPTKKKRLWRAAQVYLSKHQPDFDSVRFDVIAITGESLEWIRDAFRMGI